MFWFQSYEIFGGKKIIGFESLVYVDVFPVNLKSAVLDQRNDELGRIDLVQ